MIGGWELASDMATLTRRIISRLSPPVRPACELRKAARRAVRVERNNRSFTAESRICRVEDAEFQVPRERPSQLWTASKTLTIL